MRLLDPTSNAFPFQPDGEALHAEYGLTKRELFAAMAMQCLHSAVFSNLEMAAYYQEEGLKQGFLDQHDYMATVAVRQADALIEALNKEGGAK